MGQLSLAQYLHQIEEALKERDGNIIEEYLSCRDVHITSPKLLIEKPDFQVQQFLQIPWDDIVSLHLKSIFFQHKQDFIEAYKHQYFLVQNLTKVLLAQKGENWALPIMFTCCLDLRLIASKADLQLASKGELNKENMLEKVAELLVGCFRVCVGDTRSVRESSKKWGMLFLANQLFKIYFKVNKVHLVKPLHRAIESSNLKDKFSIAQRVTYKYFIGQKAMIESDFKTAEELLSFAFNRCHRKSKKNKRLILIYLAPVKMMLGKMPKTTVLQKYGLMQLAEVAQAVIQGNLLQLNRALKENQNFFIHCGIFFVLERLKFIAYRNLFKKVYLMHKSHVIPIDAFLDALKIMQVYDIQQDELMCIIANLIYEGKVKGYISSQHMKLVLSKKNAFPPLSSLK